MLTSEELKTINEALTHLEPSSSEEIKNDIRDAKKLKKKNESTKYLIRKFEKATFKEEKERIEYDKEICLKLKQTKNDFIPLFQIYNIITNKDKSDKLRKYFIIKKDEENEEDGVLKNGIKSNPEEPVITLNMCLLYNDNVYYSNFVKGILGLMNSHFENSYFLQNCPIGYFNELTGKKNYQDNSKGLLESLQKIIKDINRVLSEHELNQLRYIEKNSQTDLKELVNKMPEDKFKFLIRRSKLEYDNILLNIYNTSLNDDNILLKIKDLSKDNEDKYIELIGYVEEYIEINSMKMENKDLNKRMIDMTKKYQEQETKIETQNKTIELLNNNLTSQNKTIELLNNNLTTQNETIKSQGNKINDLTEENASINTKLEFMEKIVYSSLSRKVIKHCIKKILSKYKDSIIIQKDEKEEADKIFFIKDINKVPLKEANDLIDLLYAKKDICNDFVHFKGVKQPKFIDDVWELVLNFIELNDKEKDTFNKIITNDIKESFKFSQEDFRVDIKK